MEHLLALLVGILAMPIVVGFICLIIYKSDLVLIIIGLILFLIFTYSIGASIIGLQ